MCKEKRMSKGQHPRFYGVIRIGTKKQSQDIGTIALREHRPAPAGREPPFSGNAKINGKRFYIAVWERLQT